jgi:hypothetical protein
VRIDETLVLFVKVADLGVVSGLCKFRVERPADIVANRNGVLERLWPGTGSVARRHQDNSMRWMSIIETGGGRRAQEFIER